MLIVEGKVELLCSAQTLQSISGQPIDCDYSNEEKNPSMHLINFMINYI